ncbi:MAG: ClpXP protease specificity-enhancing factor SspB [Nitratireductor sp.]
MSDDLIRYDILAQEALRGVIRKVLEEVERAGLPGEHHFFITFATGFPGVRLSKRMRDRYPEEMTIVIQHSFWNLQTGDTGFEIDLSFDDIRERLRIPYAAVRGFFDPSVKFGLQFDVAEIAPETPSEPVATKPQRPTGPVSVPLVKPSGEATPAKPAAKPVAAKARDAKPAKAAADTAKEPSKDSTKQPARSGEVVSLDSFRNKK